MTPFPLTMASAALLVLAQPALAPLITSFAVDSLQVVSVAHTCRAALTSLRAEVADTRHDYSSFVDCNATLISEDVDVVIDDATAVAMWLRDGGHSTVERLM